MEMMKCSAIKIIGDDFVETRDGVRLPVEDGSSLAMKGVTHVTRMQNMSMDVFTNYELDDIAAVMWNETTAKSGETLLKVNPLEGELKIPLGDVYMAANKFYIVDDYKNVSPAKAVGRVERSLVFNYKQGSETKSVATHFMALIQNTVIHDMLRRKEEVPVVGEGFMFIMVPRKEAA